MSDPIWNVAAGTQTMSGNGGSRLTCAAVSAGIVISDTLTGKWQDVSIISRRDAYQHIAELKQQAGKNILITGSRTLWNDLLAHDLIDEIHLLVGSRILGQGVPVFAGNTSAALRLIETRRWDDSDSVLLRYEVPHQSA